MDDPIRDVVPVVHTLTQGTPAEQTAAITKYFTPDASFTHPFCRTGSFEGSRHLILSIFRWYKIMSPSIQLKVNSVAYDETNLILYVNISQTFAIWFIPFHQSPVTLTTVLHLSRKPVASSTGFKYHITSQNDLYQVDQFVKFFAPWGIGTAFVLLWHFWATFCCVVFAYLGQPFTRYMQWKSEGGGDDDEKKSVVRRVKLAEEGAVTKVKEWLGKNGAAVNGTAESKAGSVQSAKAD